MNQAVARMRLGLFKRKNRLSFVLKKKCKARKLDPHRRHWSSVQWITQAHSATNRQLGKIKADSSYCYRFYSSLGHGSVAPK